MTKRKSSIFTVVESVPNWFSARREDDLTSLESEVTHTNTVMTNTELGISSQGIQATAAETANWSTASSRTWPTAEGSECIANWDMPSKAAVTAEGSECTANWDWSSKSEVAAGNIEANLRGYQPVWGGGPRRPRAGYWAEALGCGRKCGDGEFGPRCLLGPASGHRIWSMVNTPMLG